MHVFMCVIRAKLKLYLNKCWLIACVGESYPVTVGHWRLSSTSSKSSSDRCPHNTRCLIDNCLLIYIRSVRVPGHVDNSLCYGGGARACAGYEALSPASGHLPGQCPSHPVGLQHVRDHGHCPLRHLGLCVGRPQASDRPSATILCPRRNGLPFALRHHADHLVECPGDASAVHIR